MSSPRPGFRRRLDALSLRWQARVDVAWVDAVAPWAIAGVAFVLLLAMSLARVRAQDGGHGLGLLMQTDWQWLHGHVIDSTLTPGNPWLRQGTLIVYPLLWVSRLVPIVQAGAVVQAAAAGLAVVPLWRLSRRVGELRLGTTFVVAAAFVLAPALHASTLELFHPEVIALASLLAAAYFAVDRRWWWCAPFLVLALLCRGDIGYVVAVFGLVVVVAGRPRLGWAAVVLGVAWSVVALLVIDPQLPDASLTASESFAAGAATPLAVSRTLVLHPAATLSRSFAHASLTEALLMLAPLAFLPLVSPRHAAPAAPVAVFGLAANRSVQEAYGASPGLAPLAPALAFLAVATVYALHRIGRRSVTRVIVDHRVVSLLALAAVFMYAQASVARPYAEPWDWGSRGPVEKARLHAVHTIGAQAPVRVSASVTQLVARRAVVYELPPGIPASAAGVGREVDAVVLDVGRWPPARSQALIDGLERSGFTIRFLDQGIVALART